MQEEQLIAARPGLMEYVFQSWDTALALADLSGSITTANPAFLRLWGLDTERDAIGRRLPELCTGGTPGKSGDDGGINGRITIKRGDGSLVPVFYVTSTVFDEGGMPVALMISFRDADVSVRAEQALRESEERYRTLVERAVDGIAIIRDGTVVFANRSLSRMAGIPVAEIIGTPFTDYVLPGDRSVVTDRYRRRLKGEPVDTLFDLKVGGRGDGSVDAEVSAGLIQYDGAVCDLVIVRDVSERRKAGQVLRESEERYRMLADLSPEGIFVIAGGLLAFANAAGAVLLAEGAVPADLIGLEVTALVHPRMSDRVVQLVRKAASGRYRSYFVREQVCRMDGSTIDLELGVEPITYQGGPALLVVAHDVTRQRKAEEGVLQANRKLNLLSSVTRHDILNQLNVLEGYLALAEDVPADQRPDEYLDKMKAVAKTIERQIRFTRDYQDMGVQKPMWQCLNDLIVRCRTLAGRMGIAVEADLGDVELFADPLLERVFVNLIDNAVRHGDGATRVRFWCREAEGRLSLFCEDDGCGIPPDRKDEIFCPGVGSSHGYGLFLIREILSITGMGIDAVGKGGEGARFEITVPSDAWRSGGPGG